MLETKTRYHLTKHYVEHPLPFGDIYLLQLGRRYCEPTEIIAPHPHLNWFELTVINNGSGTIITNSEETIVHSGDIYLSFPCDIHEIRANLGAKLEYDFFSFFCVDKEIETALKMITQNYRSSNQRVFQDSKISQLIEYAIAEFIAKEQPLSQNVLTDIFHLIPLYLIRDFNNIPQNVTNVSAPEILCFQLMSYIDTHIYKIKNLEELASRFNYNYGYLSGLFKKTTGKTLSEYHQNRKMETGKALVLEKKKTIGEIAEMLGYPVEGSHVKGRDLVNRCAKKYRIPVGGNTSGYYIITTQEELEQYKSNLRSRAQKTLERGELMEEFFEEWNK
jgi:AraC-like DNA-binding protein